MTTYAEDDLFAHEKCCVDSIHEIQSKLSAGIAFATLHVDGGERSCFGFVACRTTSDELAGLPGTHPNVSQWGFALHERFLFANTASVSTDVTVVRVTGSSSQPTFDLPVNVSLSCLCLWLDACSG